MADHLHKQIRTAIVTALSGLTTTSTRVYANRLQPLPDALQPTLLVTLDSEDVEVITIHTPAQQFRTLKLAVTAVAKSASGLDDTLDQVSKEVEIALASGLTVGGKHVEVFYTGMSFDDDQADKPVGTKRMEFSLQYSATANAPDVIT